MTRRIIIIVLVIFLLVLQVRLWFGEGSWRHRITLQNQIAELEKENKRFSQRNRLMKAEVAELKKAKNSVEEIARRDLGMIREGEIFYLVPDLKADPKDNK